MKTRPSQSIPPQRLSSRPQPFVLGTSVGPLFLYPTLPVGDGCTLQALAEALGPPDPELAPILLRASTEADFHAEGSEVAPERIQQALPRFLTTAAASLTSLDETTAALVMVDAGILALIVHEALAIEPLARRWDASAHTQSALVADWNARRARARRAAIGHRDLLVNALTHALGAQADLLGALRGDATDDAALVQGIKAVADLADMRLTEGSATDRVALARFKVTGERVTLLRDKAADVSAVGAAPVGAPQAVTQRQLDVQEGRVLVLIDILLKAMRAAKRVHPTLVMPELGALKSHFQPTRRKKAPPAEPPT